MLLWTTPSNSAVVSLCHAPLRHVHRNSIRRDFLSQRSGHLRVLSSILWKAEPAPPNPSRRNADEGPKRTRRVLGVQPQNRRHLPSWASTTRRMHIVLCLCQILA